MFRPFFAFTLNSIDEMDYDELKAVIDYCNFRKTISNIQNEKEQELAPSMVEERHKEFIKK